MKKKNLKVNNIGNQYFTGKMPEKRVVEQPKNKEEKEILSVVKENAPISIKAVSQKTKYSMAKCAVVIESLIKNKIIEKRDIV